MKELLDKVRFVKAGGSPRIFFDWTAEEILKTGHKPYYNGEAKYLMVSSHKIIDSLRLFDTEGVLDRFYSGEKRNISSPVSFNRSFFNSPNVENAYWAGLLATDGCIGSSRNLITLALNEKDLETLKEFARALEYTGQLKYNPKTRSYRICLYSKEMVLALKNIWNIVPRKSLILSPPNLDSEDLIKSFIIGVIDGDGHIDKSRKIVMVCGSSKEFIEWVADWLKTWSGSKTAIKTYTHYRHPHYVIRISGSNLLKTLYDYLNSVKVPRMGRKWGEISFLPTPIYKRTELEPEEAKMLLEKLRSISIGRRIILNFDKSASILLGCKSAKQSSFYLSTEAKNLPGLLRPFDYEGKLDRLF